MKTPLSRAGIGLAIAVFAIAGPRANAQTVVPTSPQSTTVSATTAMGGTTAIGLISEAGPDALLITSEGSTAPVRYGFTASTVYVDEAGAPVSHELIRAGVPVTVQYVRAGDQLVANRVIVRRQTTTTMAPTVIERETTVRPPPQVIEKQVPVPVEKVVEKPVIVEKKVPVPVEKVVEKPVPVPVPVEVQKPAPTTVIEETIIKKKKDDDD